MPNFRFFRCPALCSKHQDQNNGLTLTASAKSQPQQLSDFCLLTTVKMMMDRDKWISYIFHHYETNIEPSISWGFTFFFAYMVYHGLPVYLRVIHPKKPTQNFHPKRPGSKASTWSFSWKKAKAR